jgi:hypothetical protein
MKLPKTLYAKVEHDADASYIVADGNPVTLVEMGEKRRLGVYVLKEEVDAESFVKTTPVSRRPR